ncbi:glucocorticoid receptor [Grammomys surdaster]|uniref:glucocorticoid receptor n=1 Tax=Grammomys surdaster TaxID=491861 RepID=UPI0010A028E5|nr:glucocorticoid receptor [Grammomys surdaster]
MDSKESLAPPGRDEVPSSLLGRGRGSVMDFYKSLRGGATVKVSTSSPSVAAASQADSKQQRILDFSKGSTSNEQQQQPQQPDLSKAVSLSMGLYMGETETKVMGNDLGYPQQGQLGLSSGETDFRLLEESIANLNRSTSLPENPKSSTSAAGCATLTEKEFPQTHSDPSSEQQNRKSQTSTNGGSVKLYTTDQSTFDILQDLEFSAGSPGKETNESPWRSDLLIDENLLSPLTGEDDPFLLEGDANEDCKPLILPDTKPKIKDTGDTILSSPSSVTLPQVKTEKDDFIELCTPGVIKQEKLGPVYCQASFSGTNIIGNKMSAISVHGVSTSGGQMYHYDMNTASLSQQQDQKPVFNVIPPIPVGSENWNRCQGSGEDNLTSLGTMNFPGRSVFSNGYSSMVDVPKEGLKSQELFDEIRMTYIKELGKAIVKREGNSSQNWQRFYQLTKLLDSMHDVVENLLTYCFQTFLDKSMSIEFPEMLAEIITNQIPKYTNGNIKKLLFHQK